MTARRTNEPRDFNDPEGVNNPTEAKSVNKLFVLKVKRLQESTNQAASAVCWSLDLWLDFYIRIQRNRFCIFLAYIVEEVSPLLLWAAPPLEGSSWLAAQSFIRRRRSDWKRSLALNVSYQTSRLSALNRRYLVRIQVVTRSCNCSI